MLELSASIGLFSAFMILLITKLGIREKIQVFGPKLISKAFSCDFCLAFWTNLILSVIFYIFVYASAKLIICVALATVITRKMI